MECVGKAGGCNCCPTSSSWSTCSRLLGAVGDFLPVRNNSKGTSVELSMVGWGVCGSEWEGVITSGVK